MSFRITGLSPQPFQHLFGVADAVLQAQGVKRYLVDKPVGFPDRIELRDAAPGESVLLLNYTHQPAHTPYRASHAIFVREGATRAAQFVDALPDVMRIRTLSLRAFGGDDWMLDADVAEGGDAAAAVERLFADRAVAYIHVHYAKRGCYAGRIDRA